MNYFTWFYLISCTITLVLVFFNDSEQLVIKYDSLAKFVGVMVLISFLRLSFLDPENLDTYGLDFSGFLKVPLEDVFFAMIPHYLSKLVKNKYFSVFIWVLFSSLFAFGHLYQGILFASITLFYPYFISRRYALKTSFLTVMCCHYIYDCMTLLVVKMSYILNTFSPFI